TFQHHRRGRRRLSVITIEDDAAPADLITIDDDTESDCDLQQKEVNLEDIEKMKVEEDDSDSEDEGSLRQQALTKERTFAPRLQRCCDRSVRSWCCHAPYRTRRRLSRRVAAPGTN
ncbi:hypothetical protein E4U30_002960, partial [Claviceps sp. LM220 group G6]